MGVVLAKPWHRPARAVGPFCHQPKEALNGRTRRAARHQVTSYASPQPNSLSTYWSALSGRCAGDTHHSYRNATMGSTREARRAGR
jgi:hypothetical protein